MDPGRGHQWLLRQHCPWAVAGEVADLHENDRGLAQSWFHRTWRLAGKRGGYAAGGDCLTPVGEYRPRRLGAPLRGDDENRETDQAVPQERIEPWRHSDPLRGRFCRGCAVKGSPGRACDPQGRGLPCRTGSLAQPGEDPRYDDRQRLQLPGVRSPEVPRRETVDPPRQGQGSRTPAGNQDLSGREQAGTRWRCSPRTYSDHPGVEHLLPPRLLD